MWIECDDRVFDQEHESKMKHLIWDNLSMHAEVVWARVVKLVEISIYSAKALKGYDHSWGARNVLCKQSKMKISWDWKRQRIYVIKFFGH